MIVQDAADLRAGVSSQVGPVRAGVVGLVGEHSVRSGLQQSAQFLANRGYATLQVNRRGSTGNGHRHVTAAI